MLAGDTDGARILIARAQAAGGGSDAKIASNIAMLNKIDPVPAAPQNIAMAARPSAMPPRQAAAVIASAPPAAMSRPMPQPMPAPVAQNAPRPIIPSAAPQQLPQRVAMAPVQPSGVVMQAVPFDPLAGPVKPAVHAPRVAMAKPAALVPPKFDIIPDPPAAKTEPAKPAAVKTADAKPAVKATPVKAAAKDQIPALRLSANAY